MYWSSVAILSGDTPASVMSHAGVWKTASGAASAVYDGRLLRIVCTVAWSNSGVPLASDRADSTALGAVLTLTRGVMLAFFFVVSLSMICGRYCLIELGSLIGLG